LILVARHYYVPKDFGVGKRGFMYGYHRASNEDEWKNVKVKFRTRHYCKDCHPDKIKSIMHSKHSIIQCEDCHGPAGDHPENPPKLKIDRRRKLCLRCHTRLPYPSSGRNKIVGINPDEHNTNIECANCHNPHKPNLEALR
ncbi:MAG TPA: cytochrome C, partial [Nitrospirae bacterium]|nr:cytochrome C [Nitrospirota bacterium]